MNKMQSKQNKTKYMQMESTILDNEIETIRKWTQEVLRSLD